VVERIERQKKRLTLIVMGISISALLGLVADTFAYMLFSHQKGVLYDTNIILIGLGFMVCVTLLGLAIKKIMTLKKFNQKLNHIGELEETIYYEVLKPHLD